MVNLLWKKIFLIMLIMILFISGCSVNQVNLTQRMFANAIEDDELESVIYCLENGVDVNKNSLMSPLMYSVYFSNNQIIKLLVENGADLNYIDKYGKNALMVAASENNYEICELLIDNGIKVEQKDSNKNNALYYAITTHKDSNLDEIENLKLVKMLYSNGLSITEGVKNEIYDNCNYKIINWLIEIGEITYSDLSKKQQLFYDVYLGDLSKIKKLNNKELKIKNSCLENLLLVAAKYGNTQTVEYLINRGLDLVSVYTDNDNLYNSMKYDKYDSLIYATTSGNIKTLKHMLKYCDLSDKEIYNIIYKSMDCKAIDNYTEGIDYLSDTMKNINICDTGSEDNILEHACSRGLYNTAKLLIDKDVNINGKVLNSAVESKNIEIVKRIINNGVDLSELWYTEDDYSALESAILGGEYEIAKILIDNGFKVKDNDFGDYAIYNTERMKKLIESL